jgi:hypothetical protein
VTTDVVSGWYVIGICLAYGMAAWLLQLHRAVAPREWLRERIWSLEARIDAEDWENKAGWKKNLERISKSISKPWWRLSISTVQAGWRNIHGLEDEHVLKLPAFVVDEQLRSEGARLAGIRGADAKSLAKRIDKALEPRQREDKPSLARRKSREEAPDADDRAALLREVRVWRHNRSDRNYEDLAGLLGKAVWLTLLALAFVVGLALLFDRESFFLFGAAGALISRLTRVLKRRPRASDYGAEWSTLILSPAAGALAGWVGVLIAAVLADPPFDVLSDHFASVWDDASQPLGFFIAFVFGFSERLFDRLLAAAESQVRGKVPPEEEETKSETETKGTAPHETDE